MGNVIGVANIEQLAQQGSWPLTLQQWHSSFVICGRSILLAQAYIQYRVIGNQLNDFLLSLLDAILLLLNLVCRIAKATVYLFYVL